VISLSDPCSAWTAKANKRVQFGYGLNYLIDTENAVIVDVEATPARTYDEVAAARTMIERTGQRMGLKPQRLAADMAYGTGKFLGWLVGAGIAPQIPVWDKSTREDGTFSRSDFIFDRERNVYVCPHDDWQCRRRPCPALPCIHARLRRVPTQAAMLSEDALSQGHARRQRGCPRSRPRTDGHAGVRQIARPAQEGRDAVCAPQDPSSLQAHAAERPLARDEFHLAAIVQNLKTLAIRIWRPPPNIPAARVA
jgi:Transposase DDE domain